MPKETLIAIGAGVLSAVSAMAFLIHLPGAFLFAYLASLPLFLVGFSLGPGKIAIGGAVGFMVAGMFGGAFSAGIYGLTQALPAWLAVRQLLLQRPSLPQPTSTQWYPAGDTLCWLAILAASVLTLAAVYVAYGDQGLSIQIAENLDIILKGLSPDMAIDSRGKMVALIAPLFPGAVGCSWLIMTIVNATLAQGILIRFEKNLRPSPAYVDLGLPQWMSWLLIASAALALLGTGEMEYTGRNLALVTAMPYFLLGLSVIHTWARRVSFTGMVLFSFYLVVVLSGWAAIGVAGIGMAEQWVGLRNRVSGINV
ncbi:MAG: DUF2232 domain-containing protein [Rhodospirillales bacterium]|nr:DUF2232 domain-containing protein [Rhodospirillales bacterium]